MKNLELIRQWMLAVLPEDFHAKINPILNCIEESPSQQFVQGMEYFFKHIHEKEGHEAVACVNGFLMGLAIQDALKTNFKGMSEGMLFVIDQHKKMRGDNVKSIFEFKPKNRAGFQPPPNQPRGA